MPKGPEGITGAEITRIRGCAFGRFPLWLEVWITGLWVPVQDPSADRHPDQMPELLAIAVPPNSRSIPMQLE
jgi:hypothetical protein